MLDGAMVAVEGGCLIGWACDRARPERHLSVDVYVDGKLVRKAVADRDHQLTAEAAAGAGHSFAVELPTRVLDGQRHYLSVAVAGLLTLPEGTTWARQNRSQPDGTSFERMRWGAEAPTLPGPRLLEGRGGWAFLCDDANGNLDQLLGDLGFTTPDLRDYREILERRHTALARLGIPYLFTVVPSKEAIHPEGLPASTPQVAGPRLARQLADALADTAVRMIDLHGPLREAALAAQELYYRRDCHWNYRGGLLATRELLAALRSLGLAEAQLDEPSLQWVDTSVKGDLTGKDRVRLSDGRLVALDVPVEPETREPDRRIDLDATGLRLEPVPEHLVVSRSRETRILTNARRPRGPRAIVYRDSFGDYLQPFIGAACSRSTWLWTRTLDLSLIQRERPDVVIQVVAERFLPQLPYGDVLLDGVDS